MADILKKNLEVSNVDFIDKLQKLFRENTKEFVLNDLSKCKYSEYTHKLFEPWNLKEDTEIQNNNESQNASQDFILSQYI